MKRITLIIITGNQQLVNYYHCESFDVVVEATRTHIIFTERGGGKIKISVSAQHSYILEERDE